MKVSFVYSSVYDARLQGGVPPLDEYPAGVQEYLERCEGLWRPIEEDTLETMSAVSSLGWKKDVDAYVVTAKIAPFSSPLTIPMSKEGDFFIDALVHELAHNLLVQNKERLGRVDVPEKHKDISNLTRGHVRVHALLDLVYDRVLTPDQKERVIRAYDCMDSYKRAWEIVRELGAEQILAQSIRR